MLCFCVSNTAGNYCHSIGRFQGSFHRGSHTFSHLVGQDNPLYAVNDVFNAVLVHGNMLGDAMFYGPGAGKLPTASAVVADVIDIAKNRGADRIIWAGSDKDMICPQNEAVFKYFVRVGTDISSAKAQVRSLFGDVACIELYDDEFGFVTDKITEGTLKAQLTALSYKVIGFTRILN